MRALTSILEDVNKNRGDEDGGNCEPLDIHIHLQSMVDAHRARSTLRGNPPRVRRGVISEQNTPNIAADVATEMKERG